MGGELEIRALLPNGIVRINPLSNQNDSKLKICS
jgi:hypothetical protein